MEIKFIEEDALICAHLTELGNEYIISDHTNVFNLAEHKSGKVTSEDARGGV